MAKALGNTVVVESPRMGYREAQLTVGVRKRIPSKTIASAIPKMLRLVQQSLDSRGLSAGGPPFFRFHCINMGVEYDLEVGYLSAREIPSSGEVFSSQLPAGKYVSLKYAGKNRGYQGNKALLDWARENSFEPDRWNTECGDTFACRYEVYLSDIEAEPDHKKWVKEVSIKIR